MPDHGSVPEPDDILADVAALEASQAAANDLDDILAAVDALDAGLRPMRRPRWWCRTMAACRSRTQPRRGCRSLRPPVVQTPAAVEPAPPTPSSPFGGFASPPMDKLPPFPNVNALFLDLRIAPATPAAEALVEDLVL